jgi:HK97 gp10 family phage protein
VKEFGSLAALAAELSVIAMREIDVAQKHALKQAANIIKKDARAQIGHYQDGVGDYPAWAPLADSTEDEKARVGAPADAPLERFGDLKKSFKSEFENEHTIIVGSIDPVMEYHEFGTSKMPPRPVLGPALFKNIDAIQELVGHTATAVISGQRLGYRFSEKTGIGPIGGDDSDDSDS